MNTTDEMKAANYDIRSESNRSLDTLWQDKMRPLFGLPISFTTYLLYGNRIARESGIFSFRLDEVQLIRITDASMRQGIFQLMFNVGDIRLFSSDPNEGTFVIRSVKNPKKVMRDIMDQVEEERRQFNYTFMDVGYFN